MGHVGDVDLQQVVAVGLPLDVDGVVEVLGVFAVNGDDGQVAEVLAIDQLGAVNFLRDAAGFGQHVLFKQAGQVVLADHDFHVEAELARVAQQLDHAAARRAASAGVARDFYVHHCVVQVFALAVVTGRDLVAARDDDLPQQTLLVGRDVVVLVAEVELADHGRVGALVHRYDAAFHSPASADTSATTTASPRLQADAHAVAVHGVAHGVGRDKDVAFYAGDGLLGDDEAVAVAVGHQLAAHRAVAQSRRRRGECRHGRALAAGFLLFLFGRRHVAPAVDFRHPAAVAELDEGLLQLVALGRAQSELAGQLRQAERMARLFQRSQDVGLVKLVGFVGHSF